MLTNARLVDGTGAPPREPVTIGIADGRIAHVSSGRGGDGTVDLGGRTVLPGLVDAHIHLSSDVSRSPGFGPPRELKGEPPRPRELAWFVMAQTAAALLASSITTVRDVGSLDDEAIVLKRGVELGLVEGPRILSCGRILSATAPGGRIFGTMYCEADGPWQMRAAVREQISRGADFIKLMSTGARSVALEDPEPAQMTSDEVAAIVDEAHRMGFRVASHVEGLAGARLSVEHGVDTIEHGLSLHRAPELLDQMAQRGIVLVPTLTTFHDLAERFADDWVPALVDQAKRQREAAHATLNAAHAAGVTLAMGYDSGPPGANALELVRMVEAGLTPMQGLVAATAGSARALGLDHEIGTVAPGMTADIVVVDGDPVADPQLLTDPGRFWLVLRGGRAVAGTAMAPVPPAGLHYDPAVDSAAR
jgi:imidazolonepropionase-like amidohydrolase